MVKMKAVGVAVAFAMAGTAWAATVREEPV